MGLLNNENLDEVKRDLFSYCRQKLSVTPSEEDFKDFVNTFKGYDSNLVRKEYEYNVENITSLYDIINENTLRFKTFIEPKHDGTQIVMKVDHTVHLAHKNGTGLEIQDLRLLFGVFVKYRGDLIKVIEKAREDGTVIKMEIYGKEYSPFNVEREPLNFSVFDVLKGERYLLPYEIPTPHPVEYIEVRDVKDIDTSKVLSWLKGKEGVVVKVYDDGSLPYKKARNFNMLAFKYKPFVSQLVDEARAMKVRVDYRALAMTISELVTEYAKDNTVTFDEMLERVKGDHEELRGFIEKNYDIIRSFWYTSNTVKSLMSLIDKRL
ncbi:hypothetical protein [Stygiolobus caldivivus]|uniref:Uncharacterized protein n=1 Tax=Stygiolobus caldivivus TaxID=2824673 RepID=A0A8D5ZHI1_9CREN|nr:hypothetical protein [Stygiolobus caldivivus]BCU69719.1 hypothetical protein KN1_10160 [Stygiolobus caldivivus]